jgi:hypothetical protein
VVPATTGGWFADPWHISVQSVRHLLRAATVAHPVLNPNPVFPHASLAPILGTWQHLMAVGLTGLTALGWGSLSTTQRCRLLAAAALVALASGPMLVAYHLVLLLPPVLWAADALWREQRHGRALTVLALVVLAGTLNRPETWPDGWAIVLAVPRAWCLLTLWVLLVPWSGLKKVRPAVAAGALIAVTLAAATASNRQSHLEADDARPIDGAGFPLITADLVRTDDGSLWFAGMRIDRAGQPGAGWLGFRLRPGASEPEVVAADGGAHVWSPLVSGTDSVTWTTGPNGGPDPDRRIPCRSGSLGTTMTEGFQQIAWFGADGTAHPLTSVSGHHADPVCDAKNGRVLFLSDRGVGVRALRLWQVSFPTE